MVGDDHNLRDCVKGSHVRKVEDTGREESHHTCTLGRLILHLGAVTPRGRIQRPKSTALKDPLCIVGQARS